MAQFKKIIQIFNSLKVSLLELYHKNYIFLIFLYLLFTLLCVGLNFYKMSPPTNASFDFFISVSCLSTILIIAVIINLQYNSYWFIDKYKAKIIFSLFAFFAIIFFCQLLLSGKFFFHSFMISFVWGILYIFKKEYIFGRGVHSFLYYLIILIFSVFSLTIADITLVVELVLMHGVFLFDEKRVVESSDSSDSSDALLGRQLFSVMLSYYFFWVAFYHYNEGIVLVDVSMFQTINGYFETFLNFVHEVLNGSSTGCMDEPKTKGWLPSSVQTKIDYAENALKKGEELSESVKQGVLKGKETIESANQGVY